MLYMPSKMSDSVIESHNCTKNIILEFHFSESMLKQSGIIQNF